MINKYFLAKMNIPAYLKKFLYNRYGYTEIEGIPPITFKGNGKYLLDYRIYGASGGVGDRTKNLFDYSTVTRGYRITWTTGINQADPSAIMSDFIAVSNGIYRTSISVNLIGYDINKNYIGTYNANSKSFKKEYGPKTTYYEIADNNVKFVKLLSYSSTDTISQNTMFSIGSTILEYEPYGYKVPIVVSGKNLLPPINEWESGYLNISGTVSSANVDRKEITSPFVKVNPNETYAFSFYPNEGDAWRCAGYYTANKEFVSRKFALATSDPIIFTIPDNIEFIRLSYRTYGDGTYAQLEQNSEVTTYEPYIEPTTTNIYLDEPIEENESISLSDTNVNIPTIRGTNVLTVDTTIQPSKVLIKVGG